MYFLFLWWLLCLPHILLLLFSFFFFFFCMWLHAYVYICMHAYGPSVHVRVGLWMMTILWGCAGSCLNPQTHSTLRAGPCPWSHSMMRVRHTQLQKLKHNRRWHVWLTCLPANWSYNTEIVFLLLLGEGYFNSLLEDLEFEGREFEADSWSMAVDSTYLQTHRKDVIKRQDVIYG